MSVLIGNELRGFIASLEQSSAMSDPNFVHGVDMLRPIISELTMSTQARLCGHLAGLVMAEPIHSPGFWRAIASFAAMCGLKLQP